MLKIMTSDLCSVICKLKSLYYNNDCKNVFYFKNSTRTSRVWMWIVLVSVLRATTFFAPITTVPETAIPEQTGVLDLIHPGPTPKFYEKIHDLEL